jgi:predicted MFS family arabinose efflux permease
MSSNNTGKLSISQGIEVFAVLACAYFVSTLIRAITATLAPTLQTELSLSASDLGLLAGGYFLGFATMQLPLGGWLDRHGPRKVIMVFLLLAVVGCIAFALATDFSGLFLARMVCGVGVSACLMAPLTGYRRWFAPEIQIRLNAWMLMVGALGMVAATLPVQWLMPVVGWRGIFWGLALVVAVVMGLIAWQVPAWEPAAHNKTPDGYGEIWASPYFWRMVPVGFFCYGGMVSLQTLWAAPWMVQVVGYTPLQAASGLFWINLAMLVTFWIWGLVMPRLTQRGITVNHLITVGLPISFTLFAIILIAKDAINTPATACFVLYCVSSTVVALAQPVVGLAFRPELAGRALSAFNLVIFLGVFVVQWSIGLLIDAFESIGQARPDAYQSAFACYGLCCVLAYAHFCMAKRP